MTLKDDFERPLNLLVGETWYESIRAGKSMKIYVVSSRRDDRVIGVYSTLERAQAEGAEYTEDLQARKGVAVNWELYAGIGKPARAWLDNVPYDGEDHDVFIEEWELDQ